MDNEGLTKLSAVNWDEAAPRLLAFARWWAKCLYSWEDRTSLPNGMGIEDVVKDAVAAFAQGKRKFNPRFEVVLQLKGAIRSILWKIYCKKEASLTVTEEPAFFEAQIGQALDPGARVASEDFCRAFIRNLAGDPKVRNNAELLAIVTAYEKGAESAADVAESTKLSLKRIYELRRQIKEIAARVLKTLDRKETVL